MLTLKNITLSENGRRVDYNYEATGVATPFFKDRPPFFVRYDRDVSACPLAILTIPFVTNFEPIGWFAGFDTFVPELDTQFANSRIPVREEFAKMYVEKIKKCGVKPNRLIESNIRGDKSLMLYSGGLDATASLVRHIGESLILVTIRGADISLDDEVQWNMCIQHIASTHPSSEYPRAHITSNMREFYTPNVDANLLFGWWGRVQHGHGLLGILAPLSYIVGAPVCYIASSYNVAMHWGSTRTTDEILAWAGVHCVHDAENLSRQDKAALLVNYSNKSSSPITVRVCYSEVERNGNCGRCEKCYRTILNLVLSGADPRRYGLPMDESTYERLFKRMLSIHSSKGLMLFWAEISVAAQKALSKKTYFVLCDELKEKKYLQRIASGEIDRALKKHASFLRDEWSRFKFVIRIRYKRLYAAYQFIAQLVRSLF